MQSATNATIKLLVSYFTVLQVRNLFCYPSALLVLMLNSGEFFTLETTSLYPITEVKDN